MPAGDHFRGTHLSNNIFRVHNAALYLDPTHYTLPPHFASKVTIIWVIKIMTIKKNPILSQLQIYT